jgi:hypothetical protein
MTDIITIDQYTSLKIEDGGQWGFKIIEGWVGKDGEFRPSFCEREFKKGSGLKKAPVSIKLGDKDTAILALKTMIEKINGGGGEDVPF